MKYLVTAVSIKHTDVVIPPRTDVTPARTEEIDTETNELFPGATGPWDVEDRYEAFWNRLDPSWETAFPVYKEKVKVLSVIAST